MVGSEVGKIGGSFSTEGGKLFLEGLLFLPACSFELPCLFMVKTSCKTVTHLIINNCRSQSDPASLEACGWWLGKMAAASPPPRRRGLEDDCGVLDAGLTSMKSPPGGTSFGCVNISKFHF